MESQNTTSRLTLPDEENMLSESCTQTDSLSLPITVDLGTQTDETADSLDQSENAAGSFVIDATDSVSTMSATKMHWFLVSSREALMENMFIFWTHENNVNDNVTFLGVTKFSCLPRSRYKK